MWCTILPWRVWHPELAYWRRQSFVKGSLWQRPPWRTWRTFSPPASPIRYLDFKNQFYEYPLFFKVRESTYLSKSKILRMHWRGARKARPSQRLDLCDPARIHLPREDFFVQILPKWICCLHRLRAPKMASPARLKHVVCWKKFQRLVFNLLRWREAT